ncbi:helix-turn-helix transcriptional regulator [Paenibacillus mesophilus]|uniref:helix-turn-helix domain-containing protein n=1 Tax=Paenibacillus mesophilus TaxID=2582849 RepID=UPI00110D5CF8|nr:helix-turn-helix domain-containing protein [Paenibacillus mesophilus]TMV49149.1 helix-turn-helix transcriptional regulator [Paenibacillus mesophilus]
MQTIAANQSHISIGMIGPEAIVRKMLQSVKKFPTFEPKIKIFDHNEEAPELARQLMNEVEVLLFSGLLPYQLALKEIHFSIPVLYIPILGTCLYRALFCIHDKYGLDSISVDSVSRRDMISALEDLNKLSTKVVYHQSALLPSRDELLQFHRRQIEQGHVKAVLTANHQVSDELTRLGIPNEPIIPTEQDIDISLSRALLSTESRRNKEGQVVVGFINVDQFRSLAENSISELEVQRLKLDIHRLLLGYIESLEGHLTQLGSDEYFFITTRGTFERGTQGYKFIPIAREAEKLLNVTLSIGIGFGRSANEAGTHARVALRHCKDAGGNICYIVREDKSIIGPLEMTEPHKYDLSLIDTELIRKTRDTGFSGTSLSKLIAYMTRTGKVDFIAPELASVLGLTVRSVHRNLAALLDAGLIEIVGEDKVKSRGRPNQVFRFTFIEQLIRATNR